MVYIGIDIAKRSHVLSAVDEGGGAVIESFKFANTDKGFGRLLERLKKAGVEPTKSESGETVASDGSMSKRGPAALRWAFMQAADSARKYDPYFGDYYAKKRGEDKKHHYVALSGVARKLMGVCLALMKEGRPYEPAPPEHHRPGHLREAAE